MPMVRLWSADDSIEAHLLRHMLEQQRIPAFITGEHLQSGAGELPLSGLVDVWVLEEHFEEAQDVLEDFFERLDDPADDDELMDDDGYYLEDAEPEDERPAHDDPDNPWNQPYRKRKE